MPCGALSGDWTVFGMLGRKFSFEGGGTGTEVSGLEPKLVAIAVEAWPLKYSTEAAIPANRTASSSSRVEFSRRGKRFPRPLVVHRMVCIALRE
jgi:hypothetical protein